MTTTVRNLYQRLSAIQAEVPRLDKSRTAPAGAGGFKYVSHDDVAQALRPLLAKHGVFVSSSMQYYERESSGDVTVCARVTFTNADAPTESLAVEAWCTAPGLQGKGGGAAFSYATKYALQKGLLTDAGDEDVDAVAVAPQPSWPKADRRTDEEMRALVAACGGGDIGKRLALTLAKKHGGASPRDLTTTQYAAALAEAKES